MRIPFALLLAALASPPVGAQTAADVAVEETTSLYEFSFAYPAAAKAIPALDRLIQQRLSRARTDLSREARAAKADAAANAYPFHPHSSVTHWTVVASLPAFLSLNAQFYTYRGGAHGMTDFDSLVWDRKAGRPLAPWNMFSSPAAFAASFSPAFCKALDKERAKRRNGHDMGGMFTNCPPGHEQTLILGSSNGRTFDRIGLLIGPYVAGPYAEGSYEITLPVTNAMLQTVKPRYRAAFSRR